MAKGIYIHIPFCLAKCNYCDFNSYVADSGVWGEYIDALCLEIEGQKEAFGSEREADSIYFGGGTPTILKAEQLVRILDKVSDGFYISKDCEITTECNPATMDCNEFRLLRKSGFNRISIGMQSADNEQLKILGRVHSFEDCVSCVDGARGAGFDNLSLDLMFGIPNQTIESFEKSLEAAIDLRPEHLSCYSLKIEEGTPFARMDLNVADDDQSAEMYDKGTELLKKSGYVRYEVSNFAKDGFESRHNLKYWKCEDFIGFGAGAYSCAYAKRYSNIRNTKEYITAIKSNKAPVLESYELLPEDKMSEFIFLGLRMDNGISESEFEERFGQSIYSVYGWQLDKNIKRGTIIKEKGRLKISPRFIYVSNSILVDFV